MNTNESGRSMIEMLGVLAIIGVLSVGGLAGYSKAMSKHKINKTIDQITQIVASTRALFAGHSDYASLTKDDKTNYKLIQKGHLVPEDMLTVDSSGVVNGLENIYAQSVEMSNSGKRASDDNKAFVITYKGIPQDSCIELATQDWGAGMSAGLVGVCINNTAGMSGVIIGNNASTACNDKSCCVIGRNLSIMEASNACSLPENTVSWKFF
ncbi:MAG: hypothetical protein IJ218_00795 [Alphaproteobacteria bacterium]|nr:hypothetical protein [Alphaproteobacteria bacterium]